MRTRNYFTNQESMRKIDCDLRGAGNGVDGSGAQRGDIERWDSIS